MQVDFYIMKSPDCFRAKMFICQLIEKAYRHQHPVVLLAENTKTINFFDQALWSYHRSSFIPHAIDESNPLEIHTESALTQKKKILVNLTLQKIAQNEIIVRLLQIVPNQTDIKQRARELYRYYSQQNFKINTHQIQQ